MKIKYRIIKLETKERKIMRKILGLVRENFEYTRQHNKNYICMEIISYDTDIILCDYVIWSHIMNESSETDQQDLHLLP